MSLRNVTRLVLLESKAWTTRRILPKYSSYSSLLVRYQHQQRPIPQEERKESGGQGQSQGQNPGEQSEKTSYLKVKSTETKTAIGNRYLNFLEKYQEMLGKKFPGTMQVYRVFVVGFKDFLTEVKDYLAIKKRVVTSSGGVKELSLQELEIYFFMPKDMVRVGPVLLFSALPLAQYLVFPIAYYFPRHLLSSHFWTLQQKFEFAIENLRVRLQNYRPVLRHMQSGLERVTDEKLKALTQDVLNKLGSGSHPTVRQIMAIKTLFETDAFSLQAIHGPHAKRLCKIYGLHSYWFKRRRLYDHAYLLTVMDAAILRHGIFNLKPEELKSACYLRGLNASNLRHEDLMSYLQQWMSISTSVQPHAYSFLLHLPVLLSYNHPNNWALLKPT